MTTPIAKHSSVSQEWYTPAPILDLAREVLGDPIGFDPASSAMANATVRATQYLTAEQDGLTVEWPAGVSIWCNPPGGTRRMPDAKRAESQALLFWRRLMAHRERGHLAHAVFLAFNAELLQVSQGRGCPSVADFLICAPAQRIRFDRDDGTPGDQPAHSSLIVYVDGTVCRRAAFAHAFSPMGAILGPR